MEYIAQAVALKYVIGRLQEFLITGIIDYCDAQIYAIFNAIAQQLAFLTFVCIMQLFLALWYLKPLLVVSIVCFLFVMFQYTL